MAATPEQLERDIQALLLTWQEYNEKKFSIPYVFSIEKDGQLLMYFGARHVNSPSDSQYLLLQSEWERFLAHPAVCKIAIGEGRGPRPARSNIEESIAEFGEQGWLGSRAREAHIGLAYPDPQEWSVWNTLLDRYTKDELFLFDIMQFAHQWNRGDKGKPFGDYLEPYLDPYRAQAGWDGYDFSLTHVRALLQGLLGREFDEHDSAFFYRQINPSIFETRFNQLSRDIDVYRDTAVVKEIVTRFRAGESLFIVFGCGHAVVQERAIRTLLV
jgi:hypothetical protein